MVYWRQKDAKNCGIYMYSTVKLLMILNILEGLLVIARRKMQVRE